MNWGYVWIAVYGVVCIILFCTFIFFTILYSDWASSGGWEKLDKKIHWQRTRREQIMRDLET